MFICLVGLPASGKSTLAKKLSKKHNAIILSSDQLRIELFNNIDDQEHNDQLFLELHKRIIESLNNNKNVIYDATNISYKRRKFLIEEIQKFNCEKICYIVATPYNDCLQQNSTRERKVADYVIKKMYLSFYIPQYYEGWDDIKFYWNFDANKFTYDNLKSNLEIPQDNPHHTLNIYEHCVKCRDVAKENTNSEIIITAALYHDIGKVFTKQFKNIKGESTDIAHYYQHHLVSAYEAMFYLKKDFNDNEILNICNYIQWHMQPFFIETEKAKQKFLRIVGEDFYNNLMIIHNADVRAH